MKNIEKSLSFLNIMVRVVFISTFIFTIIMGSVAYIKDWEMMATTLVERWFTVMVGEIIVTGAIQIVKDYVNGKLTMAQIRATDKQCEGGEIDG